jgi:hypothetical protein
VFTGFGPNAKRPEEATKATSLIPDRPGTGHPSVNGGQRDKEYKKIISFLLN